MGSKVSRNWSFSKVRGQASKVEEITGEEFSVVQHILPGSGPLIKGNIWHVGTIKTKGFWGLIFFLIDLPIKISAGHNRHRNCKW
ncbi:hypothetical protein PGTUg99_017772 [Puccinia graminis f. sp. tritici]|uniref:Uncharacterized protein n=1 Tax=Puccinia graminis f. sp. tritici TaxID=56615 RepID=A0A5B0LN73_PUCGR|nr:hypothetical protein PGTUg99_017772 [Puccinia graminis f. sp. tritici]